MAKSRVQFICQNCGSVHQRWAGKCDACGEWNTLVEEGTSGGIGSGPPTPQRAQGPTCGAHHSLSRRHRGCAAHHLGHRRARSRHRRRLRARLGAAGRRRSRHRQVDPAHPGRRRAGFAGHRIVYVSGEEAVAQIRLRAHGWASPRRRWNLRPRPMSRTSSPRSPTASGQTW